MDNQENAHSNNQHQLRDEIRELLNQAEDLEQVTLSRINDRVKSLADVAYSDLTTSADNAIRYAYSQNCNLREAAIIWLAHFGNAPERSFTLCKTLLTDCDESVQIAAIGALALCASSATKSEAVYLLATIVQSSNHSNAVRGRAYTALLPLMRLAGDRLGPNPLLFSFPDDVNWDLVKRVVDSR